MIPWTPLQKVLQPGRRRTWTLDIMRRLVSDIVLVTDDEIRQAMA